MTRLNEAKLLSELQNNHIISCIINKQGENIYHYETIKHASNQLMPINSCTKSIVSALYCIGLDLGLMPQPSDGITPYFPELNDSTDELKRSITVEQLLTLSAGFQWQEFGGSNHFPRMFRSQQWIDKLNT